MDKIESPAKQFLNPRSKLKRPVIFDLRKHRQTVRNRDQ